MYRRYFRAPMNVEDFGEKIGSDLLRRSWVHVTRIREFYICRSSMATGESPLVAIK